MTSHPFLAFALSLFRSFTVDFQLKRDLFKYWASPRYIEQLGPWELFRGLSWPFRSFNFLADVCAVYCISLWCRVTRLKERENV